jgi:hypothetical protein
MKKITDSAGVEVIRLLRHAVLVFLCFLALLPAQALLPSKALAVDVVLVSSNMRYIDLTRHIKQVKSGIYDFAIQNTGDETMYLTLELSRPDIFHIATNPRLNVPFNLRLISSDDSEIAPRDAMDNEIDWEVPPGAVRRYILNGDIPTKTKFWLWNPDYKSETQQKRFYFHQFVLVALIFVATLALVVAYFRNRRRLIIPSVFALSFVVIMLVRWQIFMNYLDLNDLRIAMALMSLALIIAHLSMMRVSAISERYWRRVILNVDLILLFVIFGWGAHYFSPGFLGAMTVDWLEMFLVIPSILLCLAVVISIKLPEK